MNSPSTELRCPKCQGSMRSYERNGITVDQCGECRGVFLDRGELDQLIDREAAYAQERAPARAGEGDGGSQDKHHGGRGSSHGNKPKRRSGFLGELFD